MAAQPGSCPSCGEAQHGDSPCPPRPTPSIDILLSGPCNCLPAPGGDWLPCAYCGLVQAPGKAFCGYCGHRWLTDGAARNDGPGDGASVPRGPAPRIPTGP